MLPPILAWHEASRRLTPHRVQSYHEMLFMIDTCQANTMYSKIYSPNIIATGSSAIDQSSYSHHADNDVGVAVIDRYTYYNLDFLETHVRDPGSRLTLGHLFDSYDESKIHSVPGFSYRGFPGGESAGRDRLVMDFFGNVQNVEVESGEQGGREAWDESAWREDLVQLQRMVDGVTKRANQTLIGEGEMMGRKARIAVESKQKIGAVRVEAEQGWGQRVIGAGVLMACAAVWVAGSRYESVT